MVLTKIEETRLLNVPELLSILVMRYSLFRMAVGVVQQPMQKTLTINMVHPTTVLLMEKVEEVLTKFINSKVISIPISSLKRAY